MKHDEAISSQPEDNSNYENSSEVICRTAQENERLQKLLQIFINVDTRLHKQSNAK